VKRRGLTMWGKNFYGGEDLGTKRGRSGPAALDLKI